MEKFLIELEELSKQPPYLMQVAEKIKSHNLPVIIFGAANYAQIVANKLISAGVKIAGFAVDEKYFVPDKKILDLPVYNFDELCKTPDKYIFVLGMGSKIDGGKGVRVTEFFNDTRIKKYIFCFEGKCKPIDYEFILSNREKFFETYNLLEDDFSKKTMLSYLKAHITDNFHHMLELFEATQYRSTDEYFNELTCRVIRGGGGCYIDCGAYDGDSVEAFIDFVGDGNYKKIFAIEADPANFANMENFIREKNYKNVELINCGVWNEKGSITFKSAGSVGSKIIDDGDIIVSTDTIDNIVGDENIDFIKMDIEGAELNALKGAVKTLERCKPILALSAYHKIDDLITLPQFIKNIYGDCKFYLRKHESFINLYGLDLYAIPN